MGSANVDSSKINQWQKLSWRNIRSKWSDNFTHQFRFDFEGMAANTIAYIDDAMLIDLTAAFGAGNEPTQEWCDTNIEYFSGNKTIQYEAPNKYDLTITTPTKIQTGDILNCPYSGSAKSITLPKGQYKLECWGAQGGNYGSYQGGYGGYSTGILTLSKKTIIYLQTGGKGSDSSINGGYNGGGKGISSGRGGGGASDIRIEQNSLYARVIVAGAGGGSGVTSGCSGKGAGGGISGLDGYSNAVTSSGGNRSGSGGSQTAGGISMLSIASTKGSFGQGGPAYQYSCGGGGGGWYGGGGAYDNDSDADGRNGGGGSGYVYTSSTASNYPSGCLLNSSYYLTNAQTIAGNTAFASPTGANETGHTGNGYIRITVIEANSGNTLVKVPQTLPSTYSSIEYLQFTGTQYIDTGAIVDSNTGFDITFEVLNGQSGNPYYNLFGVRGNDSSGGTGETQNFFRIDTIAIDSNSGTEFKYGSTVYNSGIKDTSKINIKLLNKVYTKPDGSTITVAGTITSGLSMYIGCINKAGTAYGNKASMKLYRFKIYNGSILTHDFIPVQRVSDKVLGLYDLKTSVFKTNAASDIPFTSNLMNDPSSLAYFNGDSLKSQGNISLTITNNNVTLSNEQTHFGKNSLKFDGSSSYMYMPFPSTYTGDITLEGWFYQTSNNNTTYPTPFTLISSAGRGFYMHRSSSQTFVAATPSNSWPGLTGGTTALNTWTHIAMCLSGTTTYCFLDGKLKGTLTNTNTSYVGLTLGTLAGSASDNHSSGCYYKGYIAELKITKGCKWTKDFTLPTTPYSTAKDSNPWKEPVQMFVNTGASSTISSGLVELEYIEATGTQYINTDLKPTQNYSMTIKCQSNGTSNNTYAGCDTNWQNTGFFIGANVFEFGNASTTSIQNYGADPIILTLDKTGGYKDGVKTWNNASTETFQTVANLTLFALNRNGTIREQLVGKIYYCKIYDNNTLVRDFIPAKRVSDGKCGLWDKVNLKFYTDEKGGNFTAGTEKSTIATIGTPIEYIQSSGIQYIDSNFIPKATTRTIMKAEPMSWSAWSAFFGTRNATSPTASQAYIAAIPAATLYRSDYFGSSLTAETPTVMQVTNIDKNKNICSFNNIIITNTSSTVNATTNMFLLALNDVGTAKYFLSAKLYSCQIYDGNTLVRDFIPIKTTTNICGLWDKVNKVFYKNAGTGAFTSGPAVTLTGWHKIKGVWAKTAANTWSQIL